MRYLIFFLLSDYKQLSRNAVTEELLSVSFQIVRNLKRSFILPTNIAAVFSQTA